MLYMLKIKYVKKLSLWLFGIFPSVLQSKKCVTLKGTISKGTAELHFCAEISSKSSMFLRWAINKYKYSSQTMISKIATLQVLLV